MYMHVHTHMAPALLRRRQLLTFAIIRADVHMDPAAADGILGDDTIVAAAVGGQWRTSTALPCQHTVELERMRMRPPLH